MVLADGKDDGLADFATYRITQRILKKGLAEKLVGGIGKESLFELALLECFLLIISGFVGKRNNETFFRKQVGGNLRAGIHDGGIDQKALFYAIEQ